jgi:hypothetical protein
MTEFNLEDMLSNILDGDKPLPTLETIIPAPAKPIDVVTSAILQLAAEPGNDTADMGEGFGPNGEDPPEVNHVVNVPATAFADSAERTEYTLPVLEMPTFTTDEIAKTLDLRNFATLVTLNTKRWHAKVKDRKASQDIADANNADAGAFETRKRLLAGADTELRKIHKEIDEARAEYYTLTLPWTTVGMNEAARRTGPRAMPNTSFFDFP